MITQKDLEVWDSVWSMLENSGGDKEILSTIVRSVILTALGNKMDAREIAGVLHYLANNLEKVEGHIKRRVQ